ncbi:MAG: 23S rRNA (adenine(2030)-N(6))-methyltransferase RlmJ [Pseudomonadota bacterium]
MHYRHAYHAGNFADVHKHVVLVGLLQALSRKDSPWSYLETHAGAGLYDLRSSASLKTAESQDGIGQLVADGDYAEPIASYLKAVRALNASGEAGYIYPGSPVLAQALLRDKDRLVLCENVADVFAELRQHFSRDRQSTLHERDGYEAHALLPPPEKRGLVLVDPPFERRDEFEAMEEFLIKAQARFAGGIYAFWYPLKNSFEVERFGRRIALASSKPVLDICLDTGAPAEGQMRGSGMVIVNPPYRFAEEMEPVLKDLARTLSLGPRAASYLTWLKQE